MPFKLPPVYPITDKKLAHRSSHLEIVKELVRGGARLVQVRDKETPARELLLDLQRCGEFAHKHGVLIVVNDRCDLVLSSGADGVHLGQEDLPPLAARSILGSKKIIGFSTHNLAQVKRSSGMPISYIGFGPIFGTSTKMSTNPALGILELRRACLQSANPVVAIGGIRLSQIPDVLAMGAASAAVISDLMSARHLARRMEEFLAKATGKE
jgi:thiamine-phosphate pyrophosphorylase